MRGLGDVIERAIWRVDLAGRPALSALGMRALRTVYALVVDIREGQLTLHAMSLVYTSLLSLVPLLALSFSVLKGFGVHNQIEPLLLRFLAPLGERGADISQNVIGFVDNMRVGILGSLGLAMLLYTVISLIQKIEGSFNYAWHTRQSRSLGQRFSNYLSVVMVGPVLMFSAIGLTASLAGASAVQRLTEVQALGSAVDMVRELVPYLLVIAAFTFVYAFVPNAKVQLRAALIGGVAAGALWEGLGFGFATVVASSTRYTAIYSGFAVLILFLMWLYVSWLILLIGARLAFYVQYPEQLTPEGEARLLSGQDREKLALLLMTRIGRAHFAGGAPETLRALARWSGISIELVEDVLLSLERHGLLLNAAGPELSYMPGRAPELVDVAHILDAVRREGNRTLQGPRRLPASSGVDDVLASIGRAVAERLKDRTLRDLILADSESEAPGASPRLSLEEGNAPGELGNPPTAGETRAS